MIRFVVGGGLLITRLCRKVSSFFIVHGIIANNDREVYEYSFEILLSTALSFLVIFIIAIASDTFVYTALYFVAFIPLRLIAGGYHAKNHFRCFLILMFTYVAFLLLLSFLPVAFLALSTTFAMTISIILVFLIAPSEDTNKPISNDERVGFRKKSRVTIICYVAAICILLFFVFDARFAFSIALGNLTVALSLIVNKVKNEISRKRYSTNIRKEVVQNETS